MTAIELPVPGERWTHRRNRRDVYVVGIRHKSSDTQWETLIDFRYVRGTGGSSLGFKRGQQPTQSYSIADWTRHFTKAP